jgi:transcriptional regulator with XRE-family HTH domain
MEKQPPKRTVRPDGAAIKQLRLQKGWRVEDLAAKAICSVKTIENVERGANVYVFTLAKLAKELGVDFMTLVQGGKAPSELRAPAPCFQVQLVLSIPFDQFDESEQLGGCVELLTKFLRGFGEMKVVGVAPGNSTIITVLVNNDDMKALSKAYSAGKLAEIQCVELRLKSLTPGWSADDPNDPVTPKKPFWRNLFSQSGKPLQRKTKKSKPKPGPQRRKTKKHKPETKP